MPVGEGGFLVETDVDGRKCGERTGFETLVVHTVNSECCNLDENRLSLFLVFNLQGTMRKPFFLLDYPS